jgi:large subunit ribosomal protein L35e
VYAGQKLLPTDLRKKMTRAIRRRLTPEQAGKLTSKAQKAKSNFPQRKFAVKA